MVWFAVAAAAASALSQKKQADSASQNSILNAGLADQEARSQAIQTGGQVAQIRRQGAGVLADQTAGFAENGTGSGGTNALLQRSSAIDTEIDAANANLSGQQQITNTKNQAIALRAQAKAQKPGLLSLLGGGAQVGSAYYGAKR